ncbi:hypothetical protein MLD38_031302 [Melastoma candidum]|uniref:Uncharacterized protein n=1 Tax=Melastoma candidum TaxID=119954 RepID=A0ACB9MP37_9MYRT|nr:hypothetical protein MLD38_031302 [Melastoma candidum]
MTLESQHHHRQQEECQGLCHLALEEEEDLEARPVLCLVEVEQCGSGSFVDSDVYIDDCIKVEVETADKDYSPCIVLDIAQEISRTPQRVGDHQGNVNGDNLLANVQKIFQRQASLKTEKAATEKASTSLNNKWRKCKRAASFDSRKIVIVFSVLSSLGTLILIYLTLRVKLSGDGHARTS